MKYIIFTATDGMPHFVSFAAPDLHDEIARMYAAKGWKPRSAGFVEFLGLGKVRCFGFSDSLLMGPDQRDDSLIEVLMSATLRIAPQTPSAGGES
jgi:hypothetical protein